MKLKKYFYLFLFSILNINCFSNTSTVLNNNEGKGDISNKNIPVLTNKNEGKGRIFNKSKFIKITETVINKDGFTIGFHLNIINDSEKDMVLFHHKDSFTVELLNLKGQYISPSIIKDNMRYAGRNYKNETIIKTTIIEKKSNHSWFLPIPKEIKINPKIQDNKNNLKPIITGKYIAVIKVIFYYNFGKKIERGNDAVLKHSPYIQIDINNKLLNENIEEIYKENKAE